jgi:hypothetical protein
MPRKRVWMVAAVLPAAVLLAAVLPRAALAVTDDDVRRAIDRAKEFLINTQGPDGDWPEAKHQFADSACGHTEMALFTLVVMGEHPNREVISKALDAVLARNLTYNYALSFRAMTLARVERKFSSPRRELIRAALKADVAALVDQKPARYAMTEGGKRIAIIAGKPVETLLNAAAAFEPKKEEPKKETPDKPEGKTDGEKAK